MSFKEMTLRTAVMNAMSALIVDANKTSRADALNVLLEQYKETGNKSFSVFSPEGDKVATITLNESQPETVVTDQDGLLEWCRTNRPDLIETIEHPPVEGWTETRVKPSAVAHIMEDYKLAGALYVNADGEPIDGVEYRQPGEPSKFTVSYTAKDKGLSLVRAWRDGGIPLALDPNLPQIGG